MLFCVKLTLKYSKLHVVTAKEGRLMKKDTSDLLAELQGFSSFKDFYRENEESIIEKKPLSSYLSALVEEQGIKKADAIRRSELSEVYAYQIFSGMRIPERKKLLALGVGMGLTFDQLQKLLKETGYAPLYAKNSFDCIVIFGVCNGFSVAQINEMLFDYGEETLG